MINRIRDVAVMTSLVQKGCRLQGVLAAFLGAIMLGGVLLLGLSSCNQGDQYPTIQETASEAQDVQSENVDAQSEFLESESEKVQGSDDAGEGEEDALAWVNELNWDAPIERDLAYEYEHVNDYLYHPGEGLSRDDILLNCLEDNPARVKTEYQGKVLRLTGAVQGFWDEGFYLSPTANHIKSFRVWMPIEETALLNDGEKITVEGVADVNVSSGSLQLYTKNWLEQNSESEEYKELEEELFE